MEITITNDHLSASFSPKGAELQSLINKQTGNSYLWTGDAAYWGKFSPVLFPIVGGLKDDTYFFNGKSYQLPRHGFARDREFEVNQISGHEVCFTLKSDAETIKNYPFEFELTLTYLVTGATIRCTYEVKNTAKGDLYFSIGGHPAFAVPLNNEGDYEDYYLHFNKDEEITYHHIQDNLVTDHTSVLSLDQGKLTLKHELFYNDALVVKNLKSESIFLLNNKNYNGLNLKFPDFPYFGIWAAKDADFVCLEPWCGIADSVSHDQELTRKEGINQLAAQSSWTRFWEVACF